jgi:hypothetical protein
MSSLQIGDARERLLVGAADVALELASALRRSFRRPVRPTAPKRILLLRLERIGDLLMVLPAIRDVRELAPLSKSIHRRQLECASGERRSVRDASGHA